MWRAWLIATHCFLGGSTTPCDMRKSDSLAVVFSAQIVVHIICAYLHPWTSINNVLLLLFLSRALKTITFGSKWMLKFVLLLYMFLSFRFPSKLFFWYMVPKWGKNHGISQMSWRDAPDLIEVLPRIPGMQPVVWSSLLQAGLQLSGIHSRGGRALDKSQCLVCYTMRIHAIPCYLVELYHDIPCYTVLYRYSNWFKKGSWLTRKIGSPDQYGSQTRFKEQWSTNASVPV